MRKFAFVLCMALVCLASSVASAADWEYAGRFGRSWKPPIKHHVDVFLMNHLKTWTGDTNVQLPCDVYYRHDHSTDTGDYKHDFPNQSFRFEAKIVPLNVNGGTMGKGVHGGTIYCEYIVAAQGVYGIVMKGFRVVDTETGELLFEAAGNMGSEQLYENTAAEAVLQISGDHPVEGGLSSQLQGAEEYPY